MLVYKFSPIQLFFYLLTCVFTSAFALSSFAQIIQEYLTVQYSFSAELLMVTGQVLFQWIVMLSTTWSEKKSYMIVALTVSMIGSLLLLPFLLFYAVYGVSSVFAVAYFFLVVLAIFVIHYRYIVKLRLPKVLTVTWVLYRLLLLLYVTFPRRN